VLLAPAGQRQDTTELRVRAGDVTDVLTALHDDPELRFDLLADLCGVDTGETMQVVYHLWSPLSPDWVRVIADGLSRDDPRVPSVTFLWPGAEWAEREAYDMFGIIFEGNRDLRRIYLQPDFQSFPLRKDFLLADDAARSPGMGVRPMEQPSQPGETRRQPVLRRSPGTGALIGSDGQMLVIAAGTPPNGGEPGTAIDGGQETGRIGP
jgi:NADH:ubiquinone oxidoreductase subunit C